VGIDKSSVGWGVSPTVAINIANYFDKLFVHKDIYH